MEHVRQGTTLSRILEWCRQQDATDLHAQAEKPYSFRVHGRLSWVPIELFAPPTDQELLEHLRENFSPAACARIENQLEADLSFYDGNHRYRANFSKQKGGQSFSFRTVPPPPSRRARSSRSPMMCSSRCVSSVTMAR